MHGQSLLDAHYEDARTAVHDVLQTYKCYDLMSKSGKVIVFDTKIAFQLAFYALVEHAIQVAPVWDPEMKQFVGMMTVTDYIHATRAYQSHRRPIQELSHKTIADMLTDGICRIQFCEFQYMDAEDTVLEACNMIRRLGCDYIPVLDPDEGNLLCTIGYFDILMVIVETPHPPPLLLLPLSVPMGAGLGFGLPDVLTVPKTTPLHMVMSLLDERNISAVPVTDEAGHVMGLYHRSDITFLSTAADMDSNMANLELSVGQILEQQQAQTSQTTLCTCMPHETFLQAMRRCAEMRCSRLVCVDENNYCVGVISVKDFVRFFFM